MDLLDVIKQRRSVREYTDKLVEKEKLFKVLEAGRWSPSSGNVQNWRFVVVTEQGIKMQIAEACLGQFWLTGAPVIIVVASDESKLRMLFGQRGERFYSIQNCSVAIMNMMLEAQSIGLSTSWVGAYDAEKIRRVLKIEDPNITIRGILSLGYAKTTPPPPRRLDLDKLVYFNEFGNSIFK
ncbi:MAG: nitroreductase family protein [Nanoarchaeota archaeon]|nr:nitroreductase family protein [Nanoarchaeota archaeon]